MEKSTEDLLNAMLNDDDLKGLTLLLDNLKEARDNIKSAIAILESEDTLIIGGARLADAVNKSQKLAAEPNKIVKKIASSTP